MVILSGIVNIVFTIFVIYNWLRESKYRKIALALLIPIFIFIIYSIYTAIYPTDDFYYEEFKRVTLRDAPESALILKKDVSYPSLMGDYCSASLMEVSTHDYFKLLKELENDKRIDSLRQIIGSEHLDFVMGNINKKQIIHKFTRKVKEQSDHHYYIYFLDDKKTIIISLCIT